jgi:phosphatidylglycerophosphate synthase
MGRIKHVIPSIFSSIRLLVAVVLPFSDEHLWLLFIISAGISDFLDGWLARRWQVESWQGGLLDATADKMFVLVALVVFVIAGKFSLWWVFPVLMRDIIVAFTVGYALVQRKWGAFKKMGSRISGKMTTCGQFLLFIVALVFPEKTIIVLVLASICSIAAGLDYGRLFYQAVCKRPD